MSLREILASEGFNISANSFNAEAFNLGMKKARSRAGQKKLFYETLKPLISNVPAVEKTEDGYFEEKDLTRWRADLTSRLRSLGLLLPGRSVERPAFWEAFHSGEAHVQMGAWSALVGFNPKTYAWQDSDTLIWEQGQPTSTNL